MNLKQLVNDKVLWGDFNEELDKRIAYRHKQMEQLLDVAVLHQHQGAIQALRSLKQLRDLVNSQGSEHS
mgnify:CR=1 FL=1